MKHNPTQSNPLSNETAQSIYDDLKSEGYPAQINKKEYAEIARCSVSAVDNYISKGYGIPNYRKIGNARNARVIFSLRDTAEYLAAQTVKTA